MLPRVAVAAGESAVIDSYAATSPAEFFAVATEYIFTAPDILKKNPAPMSKGS